MSISSTLAYWCLGRGIEVILGGAKTMGKS